MNIATIDLVVIVAYLVGIMVFGIVVSHKKRTTSNEYFLAGRSLGWLTVGAALFATNISTIHLVGLAASGYSDGLVWGNFEWMAAFCLILLALVFAPFYFKSKITTLPEYLEKRYDSASRTLLACMAVMGALLIHIGMSLYAGALVFQQFFGINVIVSIVIISLITAIYTVLGGLKAVVVTETVQTFLLLIGAVAITMFALFALPSHGIHSYADFMAAIKPGQLSMVQPVYTEAGRLNELSWLSVLLGYPILGVWYWCSDQTIVQRVLGARTLRDAQIGPIFAGFLKILPVFLMVLPGVLGYVLFKDIIGDDNNQTLLVLITELIPVGLRGLIAAGLLAALMSTIAGALNSSATLIAVDVVKRLRPATTDSMQVTIGRISAVVVMILAMFWSTQGGKFTSIFEAVNKIPLCFAPAITAVFVWGVFWRRGTRQASLVTLIAGFTVGTIYFMIDLPFEPLVGPVKVVTDIWGIPFMQMGWWLFCFCSVVYVITSLLTPKPDAANLENLCWDNPIKAVSQGRLTGWTDPRALSGILLATMVFMYILLR
jgi:solute:Na+ symporter, SSS family